MKPYVNIYCWFVWVATTVATANALHADDYHAIENLIGARADGLGGAFSAVADDSTAFYYNPAGATLIRRGELSATVQGFQKDRKVYGGAFGPGNDLVRRSDEIAPNFIGLGHRLDSGMVVGLSTVYTRARNYNRHSEYFLPLDFTAFDARNFKSLVYRTNIRESNSQTLVGPGLAVSLLGGRLRIGATLYAAQDTQHALFDGTEFSTYRSPLSVSLQQEQYTLSALPVFGVLYVPRAAGARFGLAVRKYFPVQSHRGMHFTKTGGIEENRPVGAFQIANISDEPGLFISTGDNLLARVPAFPGTVPEPLELRGGFALYRRTGLLLSYDFIYTSPNRANKPMAIVDEQGTQILYTDLSLFLNLEREQTMNHAFGIEIPVTENVEIRFGFYTNFANSRKLSYLEALLGRLYSNPYVPSLTQLPSAAFLPQVSLFFQPPAIRNEHVNNYGYTTGLTYILGADRSFTCALRYEQGFGLGFESGFASVLPQNIRHEIYSIQISYTVAAE